jgi:hypothetical protein
MKTVSMVAAICASIFVVAAHPALASDKVSNSTASVGQEQGSSAAKGRDDKKKYCANVVPDTGSRMAKKVCRTKSEWSEEGVEVDAKN